MHVLVYVAFPCVERHLIESVILFEAASARDRLRNNHLTILDVSRTTINIELQQQRFEFNDDALEGWRIAIVSEHVFFVKQDAVWDHRSIKGFTICLMCLLLFVFYVTVLPRSYSSCLKVAGPLELHWENWIGAPTPDPCLAQYGSSKSLLDVFCWVDKFRSWIGPDCVRKMIQRPHSEQAMRRKYRGMNSAEMSPAGAPLFILPNVIQSVRP